MSKDTLSIRRTNGGVGAFVENVDLSTGLNPSFVTKITEALGEHGVLFFRDQKLEPEAHQSFAEKMGKINVNRFFQAVDGHPQIAEVRKEPDQKYAIGEGWHTDHSYDQIPALGSILLAKELPNHGGDTMFANMYLAYDALSDGLKEVLDLKRSWMAYKLNIPLAIGLAKHHFWEQTKKIPAVASVMRRKQRRMQYTQ